MLKIAQKLLSKDTKNTKYVWKLKDESTIESVYLKFNDYESICVSSQVGCNLSCAFCATGLSGLRRNLAEHEIVAQVECIFEDVGLPRGEFEVSFMGMGEPLLNLDAVLNAITYLKSKYPVIKFVLSTVGIVPKIYELLKRCENIRLQISLHAPNDSMREKIIPITRKYPIKDLLKAAVSYSCFAGNDLHVNYLLLNGFNDSDYCAYELANLLKGLSHDITVYLKLSHYNFIQELGLNSSSSERQKAFETICSNQGINVYYFSSQGIDVEGGCGQLRAAEVRRT